MSKDQNIIEVWAGGTDVEVHHEDGTSELVKVRKVPVRNMQRLGEAWGNEPAEVALYCGKSSDWVAGLKDDSFEAVVEEGRRLNFQPFERWYRRQIQTLEGIGQAKKIESAIAQATAGLVKS